MIELRSFIFGNGHCPYEDWFASLDGVAAARVATYLTRVSHGNVSNVKGVGSGVFECKIDVGPGYRVYFGKDGERLIILLGGGTKKRQQQDIQYAQELWKMYKQKR